MVDSLRLFLDKWISPSTVIAMLGVVIWLMQLNNSVVLLSRENEGLRATTERTEILVDRLIVTNAQTSVLLENLVVGQEKNIAALDKHVYEAESWHQRIMANEIKAATHHKNGE